MTIQQATPSWLSVKFVRVRGSTLSFSLCRGYPQTLKKADRRIHTKLRERSRKKSVLIPFLQSLSQRRRDEVAPHGTLLTRSHILDCNLPTSALVRSDDSDEGNATL